MSFTGPTDGPRHHLVRPVQGEHRAAVERIEQDGIRADPGADHEMAGQPDALDAKVPPATPTSMVTRARVMGMPSSPFEHVVQAAVARVVVVVGVAAKALLGEEKLAEPVQDAQLVAEARPPRSARPARRAA